jgi:hypothetical protein
VIVRMRVSRESTSKQIFRPGTEEPDQHVVISAAAVSPLCVGCQPTTTFLRPELPRARLEVWCHVWGLPCHCMIIGQVSDLPLEVVGI